MGEHNSSRASFRAGNQRVMASFVLAPISQVVLALYKNLSIEMNNHENALYAPME
jgi:hypothetical protein